MNRYFKDFLENMRKFNINPKGLRFGKGIIKTGSEPNNLMAQNITPSVTVSNAPTALSLFEIVKKLPKLFPRTLQESYRDYVQFHDDLEGSQRLLLSTLPFYPNPSNGICSKIIKTPIDNTGSYINEFMIQPAHPSVPPSELKHLIFVHGYGAGLGFYLKNLENIKLLNNEWCIHAIDLPGYGYSTRSEFPFKVGKDELSEVHGWFHSKIRLWLQKRNLLENPKNNILFAHSLGAYLMALYVDKYPNDFKKILMCSPAGICDSKYANKKIPPWWFIKLWDNSVSPFFLVRQTSILGSKFTSGWSYRRFGSLLACDNKPQFEALHKYTYSIFNQEGCGEYLLNFALKCGGCPRVPLEDNLFKDNNKGISQSSVKWVWLYGENDWMDKNGGLRVNRILNETLHKESELVAVPNSGHHLYFDNYQFVNQLIQKEMSTMK